jgi:Zn-dependent peptidase ImmA (M78 family)
MGIGVRLKLSRAAAGLSLRALEARMDDLVTAQAIGKYERNQMMPSSSVLHALARALGVTDEYLLNPAEVELVAVEFRRKALTSARETAEVRARILSEVERYLEIESILRIDAGEPFAKSERPPVRTLDDAEASAGTLRAQWRLGDDAIPNLCEFLEDRGVKVCALPLPENVSGVQATVKRADGASVPVIVVNANHPGERQRFTVAHELGHLYLRVRGGLDAEKACNRFAGAFLAPAAMLRREVGAHRRSLSVRELFQLKALFGLSAQALAYRCRDLDIISQGTLAGLFKLFNAHGWRRREPNELPPERPTRFERLCIRALAEDVISEAKASELLQTTVRELVESLDSPPDESGDGRPPRV